MTTPTLDKMTKVYADAALIERLKSGKPNEGTVRNTLYGVKVFVRWLNQRRESLGYEYLGLDDGFPLVSIVKPKLIHQYISDLLRGGIKPISAMSYLNQLRQLFAKWVLPYYEDRGWKIPAFPSLGKKPKAPRYNRPSAQQLEKIKGWYETLSANFTAKIKARRSFVDGSQVWFAATMMLEFGMRNSDIVRIGASNFVSAGGRVYLNYTPHKTQNSSGRTVRWPIHPDIWAKMLTLSETGVTDVDDEVFYALNQQMRGLGFCGAKGAYELRKICIDHIYQRFGAEMAVSISGDDIRTILHYYADPSQPNIGDVKVSDLL